MNGHFQRSRLWITWTINCSCGEFFGMTMAAGIAISASLLFGEPVRGIEGVIIMALMVFAGVIEGLSIGYFQWRVLHSVFPKLMISSWLIATVTVAVLGWILGMVPSTLMQEVTTTPAQSLELTTGMLVFWAALLGAVLGAAFGVSQWRVLRRHAQHAWTWIVANSMGWAFAFVFIFYAASLPAEVTSTAVIVLIGGIASILAGLSVGAVTG